MSVLRNAGYNLAATIVPLAISFLTLPLLLRGMGEARFGAMTIIAILMGYFNVFDFGLGTAVLQRIAASDPTDLEGRRQVFWTGALLNLALSGLGTLLMLPIAWWYFATQMTLTPALRTEVLGTIPWLIMALPISMLTGSTRGTLQGASRFLNLNTVAVVGGAVTQLSVLAVVLAVSPSLAVVVPVMLFGRLAIMLGYLFSSLRWVVGGWHPRFDRARARDLFSFGGWVALSNIVGPLMTAIDRVLIGAQLGANVVSHYNVPYQLGERSLALPVAATDALFPVIAAGDEAAVRQIALRALKVIPAFMTLIMAPAIVLLEPFLALYVTPKFAEAAAPLGEVLFLAFALYPVGICCQVCLRAGGKPRLVAMAHVIEIVPFIAVLAGLMWWLGPLGAAIAFALRVSTDSLLLAQFSGILRETLRLVIAPFSILLLATVAAAIGDRDPALWLGLGGASVAGAALLLMLRIRSAGFDLAEMIQRLRAKLGRARPPA